VDAVVGGPDQHALLVGVTEYDDGKITSLKHTSPGAAHQRNLTCAVRNDEE
jgi:hypothetical protein